MISLRPPNAPSRWSGAYGTDGSVEVGYGFALPNGENQHAVMWLGTASTIVDLHPSNLGFNYSIGLGVFGTEQVGAASVAINSVGLANSHAIVWHGTAVSALDLHPTNLVGFSSSTAQGTDGFHQVGYGSASTGASHALLWSGTANSAVDLHPTDLAGFDFSEALGVSGAQQVGYGGGSGTGGKNHALLWTGTAASAVDLHPTSLTGFDTSEALGTNGVNQVGYAFNSSTLVQDAVLWSGTAASAIDLSLLLPFASTDSTAFTIDPQGNIWGTATDSIGVIHAVEWSPVPEPAGCALFAAGTFALIAFRRWLDAGGRAAHIA